MELAFAILFLVLAIGGVVVRKTYFYIPLRELKRRAEKHDHLAAKLYRAVAFGSSLRALLWLYIGLTTAASIIIFSRILPIWVSLLIVGPILWATFSWLPASRMTKVGAWVTVRVTPLIVFLLNYLHPALSRISDGIRSRTTFKTHTELYERDDLIHLIEQQAWQKDSRITEEELEIAKRALTFGDFKVSDILVGRKKIKTVYQNDTVGPVLIDDIHKTGQNYALVKDKKGGEFIGSLAFKILSIESEGKVDDLMRHSVNYLHEEDSLSDALHAFFVTNSPVFVVLNGFGEYVGIVSIDNILERLLGHLPGSDFSQYSDPEAVAAKHPKHKKPKNDKDAPVKTDE